MRLNIIFIFLLFVSCSKRSWLEEELVDPNSAFETYHPFIALKNCSYSLSGDTMIAGFDVFITQFTNDHDYKNNGFYLPFANPSIFLNNFEQIQEFPDNAIKRPAVKAEGYKAPSPVAKAENMYVVVDATSASSGEIYEELFRNRIHPLLSTIAKADYKKIKLIIVQKEGSKYFTSNYDMKGDKSGEAISKINKDLKLESICFYNSMSQALDFVIADKNSSALTDIIHIENLNTNCNYVDQTQLNNMSNKMNANNIRFSGISLYLQSNQYVYSFLSSRTNGIYVPSYEPGNFAKPGNSFLTELFDGGSYKRMEVKYTMKNYFLTDPIFVYYTITELDAYTTWNNIYCLPK